MVRASRSSGPCSASPTIRPGSTGSTTAASVTPGRRADLNVLDLERLRLVFPEQVHDLPAGAGRLVQRSEGYVATIVAGETVVDAGELTDARPGSLVRGPRH